MTYQEYQAKRQEECNALPLFFAFSNEQFKKHMEERGLTENDTDKIYRLGDTGGFYLRSDAALIKEYFQNDKLFELMQDPEFATSAFRFEMDNHEYSINWQGDWDVCSCFSKKELEYGEDKDYRDYLKEAGMENLIPCYINAKQSHYKAFDEVNREPEPIKSDKKSISPKNKDRDAR
jgi:hypothetical protein